MIKETKEITKMIGSMSTFKRYEKKYLMNEQQYQEFKNSIAQYTKADMYHKYTICNIYYDTESYEIIRRSIEKPVYKEKLRIRSYGTPDKQDEVFFELKKKYKKEVFKRRVSMSVQNLNNYLENGIIPDVSAQILNEIGHFMSMYVLKPRIYIAYDRIALKGIEDEKLRVTFDENIRFRCNDLNLCSGDYGQKILGDSQHLMEIKVQGSIPMWLSEALDKHNIYPSSFSKYGYCYQNYILTNKNSSEVRAEKQFAA